MGKAYITDSSINEMPDKYEPYSAVNHPSHYTDGKVECIDYIEDKLTKEEFQGYCKGNALKYISRAGKKNPDKYNEDLKKAVWYLERAVQSGS